jgi:hypothetical protein
MINYFFEEIDKVEIHSHIRMAGKFDSYEKKS